MPEVAEKPESDLAKALDDLGESKVPSQIAVEQPPQQPPKAKKFKKSDPAEDRSGIVAALKAMDAEKGSDPEPEVQKEDTEAPGEDVVEGYEEVDTEIPATQAIKSKFKRFKANEKALKTAVETSQKRIRDLEEAQKALQEAVESARRASGEAPRVTEAPEYVALHKRSQELEDVVGRLRLEESTAFKEKYDKGIASAFSGAGKFLAHIRDADDRSKAQAALQASLRIPAGEDRDPEFFAAIGEAVEGALPEALKPTFYAKVTSMREILNDRQQALANWQKEAAEFGTRETETVRSRTTDALSVADRIRAGYESAASDRLGIYRSEGFKKFGDYDAEIGPRVESMKKEIEKSVQVGAPTPNLIAMANDGVELGFQLALNKKAASVIGDLKDQLDKAMERLRKFENGGSSGGKSSPAPHGEVKLSKEEENSGIVASMRARSRA